MGEIPRLRAATAKLELHSYERDGITGRISPDEVALLSLLVQHAGHPVSRGLLVVEGHRSIAGLFADSHAPEAHSARQAAQEGEAACRGRCGGGQRPPPPKKGAPASAFEVSGGLTGASLPSS